MTNTQNGQRLTITLLGDEPERLLALLRIAELQLEDELRDHTAPDRIESHLMLGHAAYIRARVDDAMTEAGR